MTCPNRIRGLTLWQPMGWAIAAGHKPIENRPRKPYRGVTHLAIHAGAKFHAPHAEQIRDYLGIEVPPRGELVHGAIICVVRLTGYVTESESPWYSGPFGWTLADVKPLPVPIVRKGALGLWRLTDVEMMNLRLQLELEGDWTS